MISLVLSHIALGVVGPQAGALNLVWWAVVISLVFSHIALGVTKCAFRCGN